MIDLSHINIGEKSHSLVILNGKIIQGSYYSEWREGKYYSIYDDEYCDLMRAYTIEDLKNTDARQIDIDMDISAIPDINLEALRTTLIFNTNHVEIKIALQYDNENWRNGYSIADISYELEDMISKLDDMKFEFDDELITNGMHISKFIENDKNTFEEEERIFLEFIRECHKKIHDDLLSEHKYSILFEFEFDDNIKVACKQYLDYFIQFLKDLGINASSNTYDDMEKTLFEVIPDNKDIALQNIQQCLMTYLNLANNSEVEEYDSYENIAYMQLKANISHLKSQLMLAQATIEQNQVTIDLLKCLNNELQAPSLPAIDDKEADLFGGVVTVGEVDCKFFKLNLGKLLKLLKRRR